MGGEEGERKGREPGPEEREPGWGRREAALR